MAILKDGSPSCGGLRVHDGTFTGGKVAGSGVTTALLERHGIAVFTEDAVEDAAAHLAALER
jgi:uncharacterized protein YbbK (DUF523 family)